MRSCRLGRADHLVSFADWFLLPFLQAQTDGQVIDPAPGAAGFHDDQVDFVFLEDGGQVVSVGSRVEELVFSSFGVEKAALGLEFAEVQSENFHW